MIKKISSQWFELQRVSQCFWDLLFLLNGLIFVCFTFIWIWSKVCWISKKFAVQRFLQNSMVQMTENTQPVLTSLAHTVPWWKWMPKLICICWLLATTSRLGPGGFLLLGVPYTHYKDFLWKVGFPMVIWVVATQICFSVSIPKPWGFMIQFDVRIFFKWVGWNRQLVFGWHNKSLPWKHIYFRRHICNQSSTYPLTAAVPDEFPDVCGSYCQKQQNHKHSISHRDGQNCWCDNCFEAMHQKLDTVAVIKHNKTQYFQWWNQWLQMNELGHLYSTSCHIFNIAFQHQCFSYKFPKKHICCMNSPYLNTLNRCFWWYSLCLGSILWFFPEVSSGTQKIDGHARRLGDSWVPTSFVRGGFSRCWKGWKSMDFLRIFFPFSKGPSFPWKGCNFGCIYWWKWSSLTRDRTGIEYGMQRLESPGG